MASEMTLLPPVVEQDQDPRWGAWFAAWGVPSFRCCAAASVLQDSAHTLEEAGDAEDLGPKAMLPGVGASPAASTFAETAAASPMTGGPHDATGAFPMLLGLPPRGPSSKDMDASPSRRPRVATPAAEAARPFAESAGMPHFVRTPSFEVDYSELPELRIPRKEQPLVSGHIDVRFADIVATMFRDEDSPFNAFLCGVMNCFDMNASPFMEEELGSSETTVQRSVYQMPLPADIPELVAHVLGLGKSMKSATFTRAMSAPGVVILQQISHTEGLLYSERMRVMNIHCLAEDASGGVAWRTYTRIVWTKPLPWTHSFIVKFIEGRVKAETRINSPKLMECIMEAAGSAANPQR